MGKQETECPEPLFPVRSRRHVVRLVLVVTDRYDVGALEPAVQVDILAALGAEGISLTRRRSPAFGAWPLGPQRHHLRGVVAAHEIPVAGQPARVSKP